MTINKDSVAILSRAGRVKYHMFSDELFINFLVRISHKYTEDKQIFWEAMRDSANELHLTGKAREVYKSMAGKYFAENRRIRAKRFKPDTPPKASSRRLMLGEIVLEGSQLAWRI